LHDNFSYTSYKLLLFPSLFSKRLERLLQQTERYPIEIQFKDNEKSIFMLGEHFTQNIS